MYYRNYTGTVSCVLCREASSTASFLGESPLLGGSPYNEY